jgi:hypothetical protein
MRWQDDADGATRDLETYLENRVSFLHKVLTDQIVWEQSLRAFAKDASLAATWVDHQGMAHTVAINRAYLNAHYKIVRSLLADLRACGDSGERALRHVLALQFSLLREGEVG